MLQDDLKGIDKSVTANQNQISSLKDDLVYIHELTRNTTAILHQMSNGVCMIIFVICFHYQMIRFKVSNLKYGKFRSLSNVTYLS